VGPRRGALGVTYLLPAVQSPLSVSCVAVVSLGDGEELDARRLEEVGVAIVEAAATIGALDVATVVHGAGAAGFGVQESAQALASGVLAGMRRVPGGNRLRELTLIEREESHLEAIRAGVEASRGDVRVHVFMEELEVRRVVVAEPVAAPALPAQLRLGITRSADELKVTTIGDEAFDRAELIPFPEDVARTIASDLEDLVIRGRRRKPERRAAALASLGARLYNGFLEEAQLDIPARLAACAEGYVVLRLDEWTVDLPWELLMLGEKHLVLEHRVARQVELRTPARQAALPPERDKLAVLVVGDPTDDLPAARSEANAIAEALTAETGADVTLLTGPLRYSAVSSVLNETHFDVLHYAGHAGFDALHEDASGFSLADRTLTAQDLASRANLPRVIVANACYSGATGDARVEAVSEAGRATRDLVSGLLQAGVRGFVGASWAIDDKAAATFAAALYGELLVDDSAPRGTLAEAVRAGRCAVVEQHGLHEPTWAAYALYGSPWQRAW
jgi:CHAT domain